MNGYSSCARSIVTFDICLHEECVRVGGRAGVRYVITKFSLMDSLQKFCYPWCSAAHERALLKISGSHNLSFFMTSLLSKIFLVFKGKRISLPLIVLRVVSLKLSLWARALEMFL